MNPSELSNKELLSKFIVMPLGGDSQNATALANELKQRLAAGISTSEQQATAVQSAPTGNGQPVLPEVLHDLQFRAEIGTLKYGTLLKTQNGRDGLVDAYQEALDLVMYLKQALMERTRTEGC